MTDRKYRTGARGADYGIRRHGTGRQGEPDLPTGAWKLEESGGTDMVEGICLDELRLIISVSIIVNTNLVKS